MLDFLRKGKAVVASLGNAVVCDDRADRVCGG